jgi:hypothetical protein
MSSVACFAAVKAGWSWMLKVFLPTAMLRIAPGSTCPVEVDVFWVMMLCSAL